MITNINWRLELLSFCIDQLTGHANNVRPEANIKQLNLTS
jgi:hypothetical protein